MGYYFYRRPNKKYYKQSALSRMSNYQLEREIITCNEEIKSKNKYLNEKQKLLTVITTKIRTYLDPIEAEYKSIIENKSNYRFHLLFGQCLKREKEKRRLKLIERKHRLEWEIQEIVKNNNIYLGYVNDPNKIQKELYYSINMEESSIAALKERIKKCYFYIDKNIEKETKEIQLEVAKLKRREKEKALIASANKKSRLLARNNKNSMIKSKICPYCGEIIIDGHFDHIIPIAKGGLSTKDNLVFVCAECNMKKSQLTINQFIKKYNLDRTFIEKELDKLKKTY